MPTVQMKIYKNGRIITGVGEYLTLNDGDTVDAVAILTDDNGVIVARFPDDLYAYLAQEQDNLNQARAEFADTVNEFIRDEADRINDEYEYCSCGHLDCNGFDDLKDAPDVYQGPVVSVDAGLLITFEDGTIQFVPEAD